MTGLTSRLSPFESTTPSSCFLTGELGDPLLESIRAAGLFCSTDGEDLDELVSSWKAEKRKRILHGESAGTNKHKRSTCDYISIRKRKSLRERRIFVPCDIFRHITRTRNSGRDSTEHIIGDIRQRTGRASYISDNNGVLPRGVQCSGPATRGAIRTDKCGVSWTSRVIQSGHRNDIGYHLDCGLDVIDRCNCTGNRRCLTRLDRKFAWRYTAVRVTLWILHAAAAQLIALRNAGQRAQDTIRVGGEGRCPCCV
jgi:hypothetical protein